MNRRLRIPLGCILLALLLPATASADTIAVTTTTDELDNMTVPGAGCSLREAVETANGDVNFGGCMQTDNPSGPDTITIPAGTYALTGAALENLNASGDLDVARTGVADEGGDLTLDGAGDGSNPLADTIIDAAALDRAIDLQSAAQGMDVGIEDLRIQNGNATDGVAMTASDEDDGGGIRMRDDDGNLTVRRVTIQNSDAVRWGGGITWHHAANGGGAPLEIIDSELIGNTAASGGGVWTGNGGFSGGDDDVVIGGATRIVGSTLTQNTATHRGGAIYLVGQPEGSAISGLAVLNSTIHANSAGTGPTTGGGGAIAIGTGHSRLHVHFSTLTDNSSADPGTAGGIQADNTATAQRVYLHASVLAGNTAMGSVTDVNCLRLTAPAAFAATKTAYNVESANSCGLTEGGVGTDNINEAASLVGALGDNGGDTQTREPVSGSLVLDLVPVADCIDFDQFATPVIDDQRGLPRPIPAGGQCDAGAVELQQSAPTTPTTPLTPVTPTTPTSKKKKRKKRKKKSAAAAKRCKKRKK